MSASRAGNGGPCDPARLGGPQLVEDPQTARERKMYRLGIQHAAWFAGLFDKQIDHPWRMEDVILCKFNLRDGRPRKKPSPHRGGGGRGSPPLPDGSAARASERCVLEESSRFRVLEGSVTIKER